MGKAINMNSGNLKVVIPEMTVVIPDLFTVAEFFRFLMQDIEGLEEKELKLVNVAAQKAHLGELNPAEMFLRVPSRSLTEDWDKMDKNAYRKELKRAVNNMDAAAINMVGAMNKEDLRRLTVTCDLTNEGHGFTTVIRTAILDDGSRWHHMADPKASEQREEEIGVAIINFLKENDAQFLSIEADPYGAGEM